MLTEAILASIQSTASSPTPVASIPAVKDAGIFSLTLRPHFTQTAVYKKSSARSSAVASSDDHVFAAQADKAVVHVYSKEKGNQEATVPFSEKITALTTAGEGGHWVILGTESGEILIWEAYSGRIVKTSQAHIQAVTAIAVDQESNYILTGSSDSTIIVWSLASVIKYQQDTAESVLSSTPTRTPLHTLTSHRAPITGIATGHSRSDSNIAISISEDRSAIVWNYASGILLRTYLLHDIPRSLVIDPADRACYIGYNNGTIQFLDFNKLDGQTLEKTHVADQQGPSAPVQAPEASIWRASTAETNNKTTGVGATLSISLSFDASRVISGHATGNIATWDVGRGQYLGDACTLPGSVTNLQVLSQESLLNATPKNFRVPAIIKPKNDLGSTNELENAIITSSLVATDPNNGYHSDAQYTPSAQTFRNALHNPGFGEDIIWEGIQQLQAMREQPLSASSNSTSFALKPSEENENFISLDKATGESKEVSASEFIKSLQEQISSLQNTQRESFKVMRELRKERESLVRELKTKNNGKGTT